MSKRTLYFDVIQDTRFAKNPDTIVNQWVQNILAELAKLPVIFKVANMRKIYFLGDEDGDEEYCSYRQRIYVNKTNKVTWNTIYETINSIRACVYAFC